MYDNFFYRTKQTVYKWWCVVYKPVYKLVHHGYWPNEKEPYVRFPDSKQQTPDDEKQKLAVAMASQIMEQSRQNQHNIDDIVQTARQKKASVNPEPVSPVTIPQADATTHADTSSNLSDLDANEIPAEIDEDVLARANEIMARLNKEAAEDEEKKQREIEQAKEQAAKQQRLSQIMKANERNIDVFIQEGLSKQRQEENT